MLGVLYIYTEISKLLTDIQQIISNSALKIAFAHLPAPQHV